MNTKFPYHYLVDPEKHEKYCNIEKTVEKA